MTTAPVLVVDGLSIARRATPAAPLVSGMSLEVAAGEVLAIVGESGSGKSLTAFAVAGLLPEALTVTEGTIRLAGRDMLALTPAQRRQSAGTEVAMIFQDPLSSFNPVRRIGSVLVESAMRHQGSSRMAAEQTAAAMLDAMELPEPAALLRAYPHQLSGGQRQRVMIALALLNDPALLIADEPTTALDPRVQLSILRLLKRHAAGRATILITHDLGVAASLADRIMVVQRGRCLESGPATAILRDPQHAYTQALIAARTGLVPA